MKVEVSNVSSYQRKLSFVVPASDVQKELDDAYRNWATRAKLPGFRPGKIPRKVLETRFGPAVKEDVANKLIQTSWTRALTEQKLEPVGQPSVDDAGQIGASDFTFSIVVDVKPSVALTTYTGVDVVYPKVDVTDDEVDAMMKSRLEASARLVEVDRPVQKGDMVMVELVARDGDTEVAREIGTMIRTEGDPYYPGIDELLVGAKAGKTVKKKGLAFPESARTEEIAGKTLDVEVKVVNVQANEVPAASDEIAAELGFEGGVIGMREALRGQLAEGRDELARNQARANMLEKLIEANPFEVPSGMVDGALNMLVEELKNQQAFRTGMDKRQIQFGAAQMADLRQRAVFATKASLILEFVNTKEGITVTDDDLETRYQKLAEDGGQTVEAVKGWFARQDMAQELKDRILEEKTLEWLLERSNLVDASAAAAPAAEAAPAEKPKKGKAKKEAAAEAAPEAAAVDTSVLAGAVAKIKDALDTGAHDAHLDALEAAEQAGKARKGVLEAIAARRK